jgi:hypothetical protein
MYYPKSAIRTAAAILFAAALIAAYLFARDTAEPIINRFIVWPLKIVPRDRYTPWQEVVSGATCTLALLFPSLFCGALFGCIFRRMTAFLAMLISVGLGLHFLMHSSIPNPWFAWLEYYAYGFLALSFIVFSALAAKHYRKRLADERQLGLKERAIIASLLIVILAVSGWLHFYYPLLGTLVRGESFEGIIVSRVFAEDMSPGGNARWWDIRDHDVRKLESRLHYFIESNRAELGPHIGNELSSYRRWYTPGRSPAGDKKISLILMHGSQVPRVQWLHIFFGTSGGGDFYCDTTYLLDEDRFVKFRCNSDA